MHQLWKKQAIITYILGFAGMILVWLGSRYLSIAGYKAFGVILVFIYASIPLLKGIWGTRTNAKWVLFILDILPNRDKPKNGIASFFLNANFLAPYVAIELYLGRLPSHDYLFRWNLIFAGVIVFILTFLWSRILETHIYMASRVSEEESHEFDKKVLETLLSKKETASLNVSVNLFLFLAIFSLVPISALLFVSLAHPFYKTAIAYLILGFVSLTGAIVFCRNYVNTNLILHATILLSSNRIDENADALEARFFPLQRLRTVKKSMLFLFFFYIVLLSELYVNA